MVRWHPTCQYLATGSADRTVRLWDITSGSCVRIFVGARAPVRLCDRNCGHEVSTPILRFCDITSGSCVHIVVGARPLLCPCIAILPVTSITWRKKAMVTSLGYPFSDSQVAIALRLSLWSFRGVRNAGRPRLEQKARRMCWEPQLCEELPSARPSPCQRNERNPWF